MNNLFIRILSIFLLVAGGAACQTEGDDFENWKDLNNDTPEWFKDAKFGIYFHWGVYTVPAFDSEWYSRNMYNSDSKVHEHHKSTYGPLNEFGYKDFVPMFKAEKFDADEWVDLFVKAGARFAGPVAEHADGFSMWDSEVNSWNAKDRGPGIDVVAAMEKAVRKRGLKFITTFHHQWHWGWYPTFNGNIDAGNPEYTELYGPEVPESAWEHEPSAPKPDEYFNKLWWTKVREVVDNYQPDILYFDSRLGHISEPYRKEMVTHFLSSIEARNKEGLILHKQDDLPDFVSVQNHEKSRMHRMGDKVWQTEETITTYSWCYTQDMELRPTEDILHGLIDVVSKNGVYLLNVSPKADGTIPEDQRKILLDIGKWLKQFGEAVYGTRPWYTYGEGPRKEAADNNEDTSKEFFELKYAAEDIRYTTKGNTVYAILLGEPDKNKKILLESFAEDDMPQKIDVVGVSLLGADQETEWEYTDEGLSIVTPGDLQSTIATVFKVQTETN